MWRMGWSEWWEMLLNVLESLIFFYGYNVFKLDNWGIVVFRFMIVLDLWILIMVVN